MPPSPQSTFEKIVNNDYSTWIKYFIKSDLI